MFTNIRYILLTAIRDRLFVGLLAGIGFAAFVSSVLGSTAMLEPEQMTLAFSAAASRVIVMIGIIVFIGFHIRNAFDTKEIDVLLSRPISRPTLVLSYALGFGVVATLLVLPVIGVIAYFGALSQTGFLVYSASLLAEAWLVVAISLFAALTLRSGTASVLAALAMYTLSRMMGYFLATTISGVTFKNELLQEGSVWAMKIVSSVIPRLDFFAKSEWLIYGPKSMQDATLFLYQAAIFIPLLLVASIIDFKRKQF